MVVLNCFFEMEFLMRKYLALVFMVLLVVSARARAQAVTCPTGANHCASLSWVAPTTGGMPIGYNVYRSTINGGCTTLTASTCTKVGSTTAPTATYMDAPLLAKTTYYWVLTATNAAGESVGTTQGSGTTTDDTPGSPGSIVIQLK
jgi:titin